MPDIRVLKDFSDGADFSREAGARSVSLEQIERVADALARGDVVFLLPSRKLSVVSKEINDWLLTLLILIKENKISLDALAGDQIITVITQTGATLNETAVKDEKVILCDCSANAIIVNLPTAVANKAKLTVKKIDSSVINTVTVDANGTQTIDGSLTKRVSAQWESITFVSDGANWFII